MAQITHQTTSYATNPPKRGWNQKQKWKITILHRSRHPNWIHENHPTILPLRFRGTQSNSWLSLVFSDATTHRLEKRMDRPYSTTYCVQSSERPKSKVHPTNAKCPITITTSRSIFYGKSDNQKTRYVI